MNDIDRQNILSNINEWRAIYGERAQSDPEQYKALSDLLNDFWGFCNEYVAYTEENLETLMEASGATAVHVRYWLDSVILDEWALLSRVFEQRELAHYQPFLSETDKNSRAYLPEGAPNMVSYVGRQSLIRQHVYSNISIAHIPLEQYYKAKEKGAGNGQDHMMALAHEVGHHVWHWAVANDDVEKTIVPKMKYVTGNSPAGRKILELLRRWLEEIYADVYGAYVTADRGTDYAFSLINMLARRVGTEEELFTDDRQHPFEYLRPLILAQTLGSLEDVVNNEILMDEIMARWMKIVEKNIGVDIGAQTMLVPKNGFDNIGLPLADLLQALNQTVKSILPQIDGVSTKADFPVNDFSFNAYQPGIKDRLNMGGQQTIEDILPALSRPLFGKRRRQVRVAPVINAGTGGGPERQFMPIGIYTVEWKPKGKSKDKPKDDNGDDTMVVPGGLPLKMRMETLHNDQ